MAGYTQLDSAPEVSQADAGDRQAQTSARRPRLIAITLMLWSVAAAVLYLNSALMLNRIAEGAGAEVRLPVPFYAGKLFNLYPVFPSYETINRDFSATGIPAAGGEPVRVPLHEYMPLRQGELNLRLQGGSVANLEGEAGRRRVLAEYARRLRARYNRFHPSAPLGSVAIREHTWPRSPLGYSHAARSADANDRVVYSEPSAR